MGHIIRLGHPVVVRTSSCGCPPDEWTSIQQLPVSSIVDATILDSLASSLTYSGTTALIRPHYMVT
ncbi:unnamed protein product [Protopolystoma xenopodis]|uniref:Uncharacterized protein n=1 Tax=Protopolystoma xenopodis TaxID=117903 RepID=A0A3S5AGQ7_9PLAT|nr:unnamed protein product [Protopolystoma xenopodis]